MALAAATHWELRGGAGSDTNGAGFAGNGSLAAPSAPSLSTTTGGTLTVATWYIVISYVYYNGSTSYSGPKSAETSIVIPNTTNDAIIVTSPAASAGATHYRVWGVASTSGGPYWPLGSTTGTAIGTNVTITTPVTSGTQCPGVDYSQQNAAQVDIDNSTITTSVTGAVITFTGYTPTAADVGNQIWIASGTNITAGYRQIIAWTATTWTVDSNIPSSGTTTNMLAKMGGAANTFGQIQSRVISANRVWVKAATYAETWTTSNAGGGIKGAIIWRGYNATRGDDPRGSGRPLIDGAATRANCLVVGSNANYFIGFRFGDATGSCVVNSSTPTALFMFCEAFDAGAGGFVNSGGGNLPWVFINCTATNCATLGFQSTSTMSLLCVNCLATGCGGRAFQQSTYNAGAWVNCIADTCGGQGFDVRGGVIVNCTAYNCTGQGFGPSTGTDGGVGIFMNCIGANNSTYGFADTNNCSNLFYNCDAYGNSTAAWAQIVEYPVDMITDNPAFTDAPNLNFTVGAAMAAIGLAPDTDLGLAAGSYLDLGALQGQAAGGGPPPRMMQIVGAATPEY